MSISTEEMILNLGYRKITDNDYRKRYQKIQVGRKIDVAIDRHTGEITAFEHKDLRLHDFELPTDEMNLFKAEAKEILIK